MNEPVPPTPIERPTASAFRTSVPTPESQRFGDQQAVERAHARFGPGLRRFFSSRVSSSSVGASGDLAVVDDLCQQAWAECWKSVRDGRYDPSRAALSTFLYAVASNIWLRHRRKATNSRESATIDDRATDPALGPDRDPAKTVAFSELLDAVLRRVTGQEGDLTAQERAFLLSVARGASDRDLAAQFQVAPSTAHARKTAALAKLREALAQVGFRAEDQSAER